MSGHIPNCYQSARKVAELSQEAAAELLDISVRSLADYETALRVPPNATVIRMVEEYRTPWLALAHLKNTSGPLGVLPEDITIQSLPTATLTLIDRATALADEYRRLVKITADGRIDENEEQDFDEIKEAIRGVIAAGFQILYTDEGAKKDHPDAGTSRRSVFQDRSPKNDCKNSIAQRHEEHKNTLNRKGGGSL